MQEPGTTYTSYITTLIPVPYTITAIETQTSVYTTPVTIPVTLPQVTVTQLSISTFKTTELSVSTYETVLTSYITSFVTDIVTGNFPASRNLLYVD